MKRARSIKLGISALVIYILGGVGIFAGIWLIVFRKGVDVMGLGHGHTIGYLLLCAGTAFSILGVLFMRIFRNRGIS